MNPNQIVFAVEISFTSGHWIAWSAHLTANGARSERQSLEGLGAPLKEKAPRFRVETYAPAFAPWVRQPGPDAAAKPSPAGMDEKRGECSPSAEPFAAALRAWIGVREA